MSQSQKALDLSPENCGDSEVFLLRRLGEHGAPVFVMDAPHAERIERYREKILSHGLESVIVGRKPDGKPERYAELFERLFNTPLVAKRKGRSA